MMKFFAEVLDLGRLATYAVMSENLSKHVQRGKLTKRSESAC